MKSIDPNLERNVLIIFLFMLSAGMLIAFVGNLDSTKNEIKDKPEWMNLTSNETHLTFDYNATNSVGFHSLLLQASWLDPYTDTSRELYSIESEETENRISFPKLVTLGSPAMIVGVTVETDISPGTTQTRKYIWRVVQEPLTFGLDSPTVDYIR